MAGKLEMQAWARSIPIRKRDGSIAPEELVALHEIEVYDPAIRVMWDPARQRVTVWRQVDGYGPAIQCDSPFGRAIDNRLLEFLALSDLRRVSSMEEYIRNMDEENEKVARERMDAIWGRVDHAKWSWAYKRFLSSMDGKPRGLHSAVPDAVIETPSPGLTLALATGRA